MHLVIDLANQIILPLYKSENVDSWFFRIKRRVRLVTHIARRMRLQPLFVCDAGYTTREVIDKWKSRREKEVLKCYRKIPYCADRIVCEWVLKQKMKLIYDKRYNADDIVATVAGMHTNSIILSRDADYFRYDNHKFLDKVYFIEKYSVEKLIHGDYRRTPLETIKMYTPTFCEQFTELSKFVYNGDYVRGTAFPWAERNMHSSLHLATRKLRQLLYNNNVHEIFPVYDDVNAAVLWIQDVVAPLKGEFPKRLEDIENYIIENIPLVLNENHKRTIKTMAAELYSEKYQVPMIDLVFPSKC